MHSRLADRMILLAILAMAAGARVGYLVRYADNAQNDGPLRVQDASLFSPPAEGVTEADALVHNRREHRWFGSLAPLAAAEERTAHVAPGYPWLRGELERLPLNAPALIRWTQCGLGTLAAGLYFLFARRAFRSRAAALLAGLFCALHPFWIVGTATLADGVLTSFLLAACLFLGSRGVRTGEALTSLLYGLTLAALALVRAALLPFAVAALLWFLWRCRRLTVGWRAALLAFLGFLTALTPWTLRNLEAFDDVFPIVDSTYLHLWIGNNPRAVGGPLSEQDLIDALAEIQGETPAETARRLHEQLDQPARYRALARPFWEQIRHDPVGTVHRRLAAGLCFVLGQDWLTQRRFCRDNPAVAESATDRAPYHGLLAGSLLAMLLLAFLGWRWSFNGWRRAMPLSLAVVWIPLPYLLGHAESLSGPRLPLDGVLGCYAAFALSCLLPGGERPFGKERPAQTPSDPSGSFYTSRG